MKGEDVMKRFRFDMLVIALATAGGGALLVGCAQERHDDIPLTAEVKMESEGPLTYEAPDDGMIYVSEVGSNNKMLYSGAVQEGQTVKANPEEDRIELDGKTVTEVEMKSTNRHRIFFEPAKDDDDDGDEKKVEQETTIIERDQPVIERRTTIKEEGEEDDNDGDNDKN